jgi:hypothetical protein
MSDIVEPRTVPQIVSDLLQVVVDQQWSGETNSACHCHPVYRACCPKCFVEQYDHNDAYQRNPNPHKDDCPLQKLITETTAYLEVENKLAEERGKDTVYVP